MVNGEKKNPAMESIVTLPSLWAPFPLPQGLKDNSRGTELGNGRDIIRWWSCGRAVMEGWVGKNQSQKMIGRVLGRPHFCSRPQSYFHCPHVLGGEREDLRHH
jgi:hypothetical protein